jgi:hypothetical protein
LYLFQAAQEKLPKAARLFDLSKYRLHDRTAVGQNLLRRLSGLLVDGFQRGLELMT